MESLTQRSLESHVILRLKIESNPPTNKLINKETRVFSREEKMEEKLPIFFMANSDARGRCKIRNGFPNCWPSPHKGQPIYQLITRSAREPCQNPHQAKGAQVPTFTMSDKKTCNPACKKQL